MKSKKFPIIVLFLTTFVIGTPLFLSIFPYPESSDYNSFDSKSPITPHLSGFNESIYINGNPMFVATATSEGWNGDGTPNNPYIIEYYNISASTKNGIEIRNTNLHFIVQNVSITNGLSNYFHGFYLFNVSNGIFKNNTANNNLAGFILTDSFNNTFTDNRANSNLHGFRFLHSHDNTLANSTINSNLEYGIYLDNSNYNNITGNSLFFNQFRSIFEVNCVGNYFKDNVYNPETFFLTSDCGEFDADGSFNLTWTVSGGADNYTLYQNGVILAENLITTNYTLTDLAVGTYRYYVRAFNINGYVDSNHIRVTVKFLIYINGNQDFHQKAMDNNFTGDGSISNPYIIENYTIYATIDHGIYIKNTNLYFVIRNVTISEGKTSDYNGFFLENVTNGRLEENIAFNNRYGFYLKDSFNNTLIGNTAFGNINGLTLNYSAHNNLTCNFITNNRHGFCLESSSNNTVSSNQVKDNTYLGFYISSSFNNTLKKNNATGNLNGFTISSSNLNIFFNNSANNNDQHGFWLLDSHYNTISENSASYNQKYGIYLDNSTYNTISGNMLIGNGIGTIYERILENKKYPDVFFIATIVFLIGLCLYIAFISYKIISKKEITLKTFKKIVIKRKKKNS